MLHRRKLETYINMSERAAKWVTMVRKCKADWYCHVLALTHIIARHCCYTCLSIKLSHDEHPAHCGTNTTMLLCAWQKPYFD